MIFFKTLFRDSKQTNWTDGFTWLGWHLVCGLMPVWITLLLLRCFKQDIAVHVFTGNGEFALYSASFLGTCLYLVLKDFKNQSFPNRGMLALIIVPLLLLSGVMYSFIALMNLLQGATSSLFLSDLFDKEFLRIISLWLLPLVFVLTFLLTIVDSIRSAPDVKEIAAHSYTSLSDDFDKLK